MNYKLAKQLRDAGWKSLQEIDDYSLKYEASQITLSELIDACGHDFKRLIKDEEELGYEGVTWIACGYGKDGDSTKPHLEGHGKAKEEAVTKLWLKLNKSNIDKRQNL